MPRWAPGVSRACGAVSPCEDDDPRINDSSEPSLQTNRSTYKAKIHETKTKPQHMQTTKFVPLWSQGKDSFLKDNPNATLSIFHGDNVSDLVVELRNPQLSGNDLTYDARILEGTPPTNGGACALFIDVIGMPATPMSYAGVARRGFRRGYYGVANEPRKLDG